MRIPIFLLAATAMIVGPLASQSLAQSSPEQREASYEAHKGDFDYLLGDWEFISVSQEWGKGGGYWTAVRVGDGALILDEYRVVGDSGQTWVVINTLRAWNATLEQWDLVSTEKATGLHDLGTGRRVGAEMHITQKFGALTATPTVWRIRYYDIGPDRFSWRGDRSTDDGKTWQTDFLKIEARRIGPPRSMTALTSAATRRNPR